MKIGILGGGQLGRMLALAGYPLGLRFHFLDPSLDAPASHLVEHIVGAYDDHGALDRFAHGIDLATYEFENVPVESVRYLAGQIPVFPSDVALEISQNRLQEKRFLQRLGIPTVPFAPVDSRESLDAALKRIGVPAVLKTCRFGYDGKGQRILRSKKNADEERQQAGGSGLLLEAFIPFEKEASLLAVRSRSGETAFYPMIENYHHEGILRLSIAPLLEERGGLRAQAEEYAQRVLDELRYVGVLALEFFVHEGKLLANEMAPRVHNSGHWTIEGAETSQFENHLRAILGLPLGSTRIRGYAAMVNLIGSLPEEKSIMRIPDTHLHLYGKEPRPGRKLGHVTVTAIDRPSLEKKVKALAAATRLPEMSASAKE